MGKYNKIIAGNDKLELIHVSADQTEKAAEKWAAKEKFPWPTVMADKLRRSGLDRYEIRGYPTYILIDKDGKKLAEAHSSAPIFKKIAELGPEA